MSKTLGEYVDWLDSRELLWPSPPDLVPLKATPSIRPLEGICAVIWNLYGTLIRIADGELLVLHPQQIRMQVALEKTIQEFNMWNSMSRKPGAPWEYMLQQYRKLVEDRQLAGTGRRGDVPEVNLADIWQTLLKRLEKNDYSYDEGFYGDLSELAEKVAYFFHANLQGVAAMPDVVDVLTALVDARVKQGLLADAQPFSLAQSLRAFSRQGTLPPLGKLFDPDLVVLSCREGVRKPSPTLYAAAVQRLAEHGIEPHEALYISSSLRNDLSVARRAGFRTALLANDKASLRLDPRDLKDPQLKPDRLVTALSQIPGLLGIEQNR